MPRLLPRAALRGVRPLLIALSLLTNTLAAAARQPAPLPPAQAQVESSVRIINLPTNDIVYDGQTQKIYASVPSSAGAGGNSITEVDPSGGTVGQSVFVGSEPNKLALADDGQTLYVGLDGASAVRRFDVPTQTAGQQFSLGLEQVFGGPVRPADLAVAPGNPNLLAVAQTRSFVSPPGLGVVIFDNGVARPNSVNVNTATFLAFSSSAATLYGSTPFSEGLRTMTVDANGVTQSNAPAVSVFGRIQFAGGLVYSASGRVVNPSTNTLVGTFAGVSTGPFVVDSAVGRAYYLIASSSGGSNQTFTLRAFDLNTFTPVGDATLGGVNGTALSLVRWGANGLAFNTSAGQLFLIQTSLVPSQEPIPQPTPTPSPTPFDVSVRQIALNTKDLIYSPSSQTIYASVPSSAGAGGNSVVQINPARGDIDTPVFGG